MSWHFPPEAFPAMRTRMTPAQAIAEAHRAAYGVLPDTSPAQTARYWLAKAVEDEGLTNSHHAAARLRRWSQVLAEAARCIEKETP